MMNLYMENVPGLSSWVAIMTTMMWTAIGVMAGIAIVIVATHRNKH